MNFVPGTRLLSECGLYFTLLLILPLEWPAVTLWGTAAACSLSASLAGMAKQSWMRWLCGLLPLAALLLPGSNLQRGLLAIPALYCLGLCLTDRLWADAWQYGWYLRLSIIAELLLLTVGCTLRPQRGLILLSWGTAYFIFGIYYQRQLRLGRSVNLRNRLRDLGGISLLPLGAAGICALVIVGWKPFGSFVLGFTTVVANVLRVVVGASTHLYHNFKVDPVKVTIPITEATETTAETTQGAPLPDTWPQMGLDSRFFLGLALVGGLVLLGLLFYSIHRARRVSGGSSYDQTFAEAEDTVEERPMKAQAAVATNRRRVRKAYSTYLRLLQSRGMFRRTGDTSRDVLESAVPYADNEKSSDLRSIYIRARYHSGADVTDEDARQAGQLVKQIKKSMK